MKYVTRKLKNPDLWIKGVENPGNVGHIRLNVRLSNQGNVTHTMYEASVEISLWQLNQLVSQARVVLDRQLAGIMTERKQLGF